MGSLNFLSFITFKERLQAEVAIVTGFRVVENVESISRQRVFCGEYVGNGKGSIMIGVAGKGSWFNVRRSVKRILGGALVSAFFSPSVGMTADRASPAIGVEAICRLDRQPEVKKLIVLDKEGTQVNSLADCRKWLASDRSQALRQFACIKPFEIQPKLKSIKCVFVQDQAAAKPSATQ